MSHSRKTLVSFWAILLAFSTPTQLLANSNSSVIAQSSTPSFTLPESLPDDASVTVSGTSSMMSVNEALKQRYEDQYPDARVELQTGNSDEALVALQNGEVDLAAVGRPLTNAEKAAGLEAIPVDRGKIAIIVGPDNPFDENLTFEQFARIFRGEITDWSEIGGEPGPIRLVDRPDFSDTRRALSTYDVFQTAPFETGSNVERVIEDETEAVIEALGTDGIGYAIADQVVNQDNVNIISMHQTLPDDPRYPYSQIRTYVYQRETATPATLAFLGFATSEPGQEVIAAATPPEVEESTSAETAATPTEEAETEGTGLVVPPGASTAAPTPDTIAEPSPTETETALVPDSDVAAASTERGFPWWLLLLLGIPLLGALLWWLLKGSGEPDGVTSIPPGTATPPATGTAPTPTATGAATTPTATGAATTPTATGTGVADPEVPPVAATALSGTTPTIASRDLAGANPITSSPTNLNLGTAAGIAGAVGAVGAAAGALAWARRPLQSRITLSHQAPQSVEAVWDVPQADMDAAIEQGGQQFQLRIYDVTETSLDSDPPTSVQEFDCDESTDQRLVPVPTGDRDYISEVGYVTDDNQWLPLCRSNSVYVPASESVDLNLTNAGINGATPTVTDSEPSIASPWLDATDPETPAAQESNGAHHGLTANSPSTDPGSIAPPEIDAAIRVSDTPETTDTQNDSEGIGLAGVGLGGAAIAAGTMAFLGSSSTQLRLSPGSNQTVVADWDIPIADIDAVKQQGGEQLQLRVYEVTDVDVETEIPNSVQQFDCDESTQQLQVSVPNGDRDYASAIGYVTNDNRWLPICGSNSVYIPASTGSDVGYGIISPEIATEEIDTESPSLIDSDNIISPEVETEPIETTSTNLIDSDNIISPEVETEPIADQPSETQNDSEGIGLPGIALGSSAIAAGAIAFLGSSSTQLRLSPGSNQTVVADWDIPIADIDAVKQQGGEQLQLRVYEVTDVDVETEIPNSVQQFDCDESTQQLQVSVPNGDRDYASAIGYVTNDNRWLPICGSNSVYIPASTGSDVGYGIISPEIATEEIDTELPSLIDSENVTNPEVETEEIETVETTSPSLIDSENVTNPEIGTEEVDTVETTSPSLIDSENVTNPEIATEETPDQTSETQTDGEGIGLAGVALGGAAIASAAISSLGSSPTQLDLTSVEEQTVIANWEISPGDLEAVKQQGGTQLQLRVYDVTDVDVDTEIPNSMQQFDCDESTQQLQVSVPTGDRDYASAIGYVTDDNRWLPICCSEPVYVPSVLEIDSEDHVTLAEIETEPVEIPQAEQPLSIDSENVIAPLIETEEVEIPETESPSLIDSENLTNAEIETEEVEIPEIQSPSLIDSENLIAPEIETEEVDIPETELPGLIDSENLTNAEIETEEVEIPETQSPSLIDSENVIAPEIETEEVDTTESQLPGLIDSENLIAPPIETEEVDISETQNDSEEIGLPGIGLAGAAIAAGTISFLGSPESQLRLIPGSNQTVVADWDIPQADIDAAKQQGGIQLHLWVYDVTDIDIDTETPHSMQQFDCDESTQQLQVSVRQGDRNYAAIIGYFTTDTRWLPLCRSNLVYIPASTGSDVEYGITNTEIATEEIETSPTTSPSLIDSDNVTNAEIATEEIDTVETTSPSLIDSDNVTNSEIATEEIDTVETTSPSLIDSDNVTNPEIETEETPDQTSETQTDGEGIGLAGVGLGAAALGGAAISSLRSSSTQLHLTSVEEQTVIANWEISQGDLDGVKQQGGIQLQLRVYDVTDVDVDTEIPHSMQQFDCDESMQQQQLQVPYGDRDYASAIGYVTSDDRWLPLCRSEPVYVSSATQVNSDSISPLVDVEETNVLESVKPNEADTQINLTSADTEETAISNSGMGFPGVVLGDAEAPGLGSPQTQLGLTPASNQTVIANWEISPADAEIARQRGGIQLLLRVYDVTDIDIDTEIPHSMQQFDCDELTEQVQVVVYQEGCDYLAEVGYITANNQWLPLCRSESIFVPASFADEESDLIATESEDIAQIDSTTVSVVTPPPSRLNLIAIMGNIVKASWDLPQADIDAVKQQGGTQLQLRVYDVTEVDLHTQDLDTIQQFDCDESTQEIRVSVPRGDRNYASAIGYVAAEDQWFPLCCSDDVYVPASPPLDVEALEINAGLGATAIAMGSTEAVNGSNTEIAEVSSDAQMQPGGCEIQHLRVHSRHHCLLLDQGKMTALQEVAVKHILEPGLQIIRIKAGTFGYGDNDSSREPFVLLWIYGGKVINKKTNIPTESTWSTLNGYDETLTLEVLETSTLCAFFLDTNPDDNYGELTLSVIQLDC